MRNKKNPFRFMETTIDIKCELPIPLGVKIEELCNPPRDDCTQPDHTFYQPVSNTYTNQQLTRLVKEEPLSVESVTDDFQSGLKDSNADIYIIDSKELDSHQPVFQLKHTQSWVAEDELCVLDTVVLDSVSSGKGDAVGISSRKDGFKKRAARKSRSRDSQVNKERRSKGSLFCKTCNRYFSSIQSFNQHQNSEFHARLRDGDGFSCNFCSRKFCIKKSWKIHLRKHKMEGNHICDVCGQNFVYEVDFRRHKALKHGEDLPKCSNCSRCFVKQDNLKRHKQMCGTKRFICDECGKGFSQQCLLNSHKKSHTVERPFHCDVCDHKSKSEEQLSTHMNTHDPVKHLPCDRCEKKFANFHDLRMHQCSGLEESQVTPSVPMFMCGLCKKGFMQKLSLVEHMQLHGAKRSPALNENRKKEHQCRICRAKFSSNHDLKQHEKSVHFIDEPYICGFCDEPFETGSDLSKHKKAAHKDIKNFMCGICKKTYPCMQQLEHHLVVHSDNRPFKCTKCEKSFKKASHLRSHRYMHEGEKKFECDKCSKKFSQRSHLTAHIRSHTRPFICSTCEKGFPSSSDLKNHTYSHTKEKPFKCSLCDKGYVRNSLLKEHLLKKH